MVKIRLLTIEINKYLPVIRYFSCSIGRLSMELAPGILMFGRFDKFHLTPFNKNTSLSVIIERLESALNYNNDSIYPKYDKMKVINTRIPVYYYHEDEIDRVLWTPFIEKKYLDITDNYSISDTEFDSLRKINFKLFNKIITDFNDIFYQH